MPNPFVSLAPALNVLASEGRVLSASGQAILDGARPDIEEIYDRATGGEAQSEGLWETEAESLYRPVAEISREERHLFRHFVDGSTKTYFIGTLLEHQRSSPLQLAQVGAARVRRSDDGRLRIVDVRHQIALLLDKSVLSSVLWEQLESAVSGIDNLILLNTANQNEYADIGGQEPRARGAHRANWLMREAELELAQRDRTGSPDDSWLIADGSLGNEYLDWDGPPLVGVAKTFRRDSAFVIGTGPRARTLNLFGLLADLDEGHRTAVFPRRREGRSQLIAYWYVRLRPQTQLDYPLMGVVKVEIPCRDGSPVDSDLADEISGALVAERSVTPHGRDSRWHAHLYPVWIAEQVIRDSFYSDEVLKAALRWPSRGHKGGAST